MSARSDSKSKLSRRKFLLGSAATAAGVAVTVNSERANAFFNAFGFMKKSAGSGQTSNGYMIGQSLRFNGSGGYLKWTPSAAGSTTKWTWSAWIKRGSLGTTQSLFISYAGGLDTPTQFMFTSSDTLKLRDYYTSSRTVFITSAVFRDPCAWMHVVLSIDTTQGTNTDRAKLYINGMRVTTFSTYDSWSGPTQISGNYKHCIGCHVDEVSEFFSGYLGEVYFIDGQALDASSFGQIDTQTGQWIPKAYSGAYGVNGYYLKFADNSNVTASTLGKDSAPIDGTHVSANNWTPSGFATHDQVLDSPTNNFCTLNPIWKQTNWIVSNGSLAATSGATNNTSCGTTMMVPAGQKIYFEWTVSQSNWNYDPRVGFTKSNPVDVTINACRYDAHAWSIQLFGAGASNGPTGVGGCHNNTSTSSLASCSNGDVVGVCLDLAAGTLSCSVNGGPKITVYSGLDTTSAWLPFLSSGTTAGDSFSINFGQGGQTGIVYDSASGGRFKYTPPAGFKALSTANLPAPTIKNSSLHFTAKTFSGTGAGATGSISALGFAPDLVWWKDRNSTDGHNLFDALRGPGKLLQLNSSSAESTNAQYLSSFDSNGFSWGTSATNSGSNNYIAWCWKANGTAVTNNAGTITSQVSGNSTAGFSVVTFSGAGSSGTIGHGLGVTPAMCIFKARNNVGTTGWNTWHRNLAGDNYYLDLSTTGQQSNAASNFSGTWTSATFGLNATPLTSGANLVAYLWAEVAGFSQFGSYTGNGSADGPFVYCGFKPRWVMIKKATNTGSWFIIDTVRSTVNPVANSSTTEVLIADATSNEAGMNGGWTYDILSNGFKQRNTSPGLNNGGDTYIFAAFAEAPFKYATAR